MVKTNTTNTALKTLDSRLVDVYTSRWKIERVTLIDSQKDNICKLYMSKILKLDNKTIEKFVSDKGLGVHDAYHKVGIAQSAIPQDEKRLAEFWLGVKNLMPKEYNNLDVSWLSHVGGLLGVFDFLFRLDTALARKLEVNGVAYK